MTFVKKDLTNSMKEILIWSIKKKTEGSRFWRLVPQDLLSKKCFNESGLGVTDLKKLLDCNYVTSLDGVHRLVKLGWLRKREKDYRNSLYVLTSEGVRKSKLLLKYYEVA